MEVTTDESFKSTVLDQSGVVVVDFFATWCGPCRQMLPIVEELSGEMAGQAKFVKVDVDDAMQTADSYGIQSIPTFILFKNGEEKERLQGAQSKSDIVSWVKKYL